MLGSLSTAGGAECTLKMRETQSKLKFFSKPNLPNVARRASLVCLDSCPVVVCWVWRSSVQAKGVNVASGRLTVTPCGNLDFVSLETETLSL